MIRRIGPALAMAALGIGCGEELGPERFPTAHVRGSVAAGGRPVGGGFIEFQPIDGTRGNLRVGPIRPDGSFAVDLVPVGKVAVGLAQLPIGPIPTASGPVDPRDFRLNRAPLRRTIAEGPDVVLAIDLDVEANRLKLRGRGR